MNRKKRKIVIALLLLLILMGLPTGIIYREMRQARLDRALIAASKAGDSQKILAALAEGANGEARDTEEPTTFKGAFLQLLDHFRRSGKSATTQPGNPALLLLYQTAESRRSSSIGAHPDPGPELEVVRALLDHGAQVNDQRWGTTPLWYAVRFPNDAIVSLLVTRGADVDAKNMNNRQKTPLMLADVESTRVLLEHGANIEARDTDQWTPLIYAVTAPPSDKIRILLEHGANIEATDDFQDTPLLWAVRLHRSDVVRILLEHGAKVSPKDQWGRTALDNVRHDPNSYARKIEVLLRKHGAK